MTSPLPAVSPPHTHGHAQTQVRTPRTHRHSHKVPPLAEDRREPLFPLPLLQVFECVLPPLLPRSLPLLFPASAFFEKLALLRESRPME